MHIAYKIYCIFNPYQFENIFSMIHYSFVDMFSLTVLFLVIFFTFCLSSQPTSNKRSMYIQKAISYSKEKHFLEISLLVHRPTPLFLSKYQKLHKHSGKQIVFACREIRKKKKLLIEDKRNICLVYMSVCL